jgi:uncharacterized protein (DUF2141 family)
MKYLILPLLFLIGSHAIAQQSLEVQIDNIKTHEGQIILALYENADTFMGDSPLKWEFVKVDNSPVKVLFKDLPPGEYALSIIHDINNNKKLDKNLIGIPKEPFGFTNNVMGTFGAPSFEDAKVILENSDKTLIIELREM